MSVRPMSAIVLTLFLATFYFLAQNRRPDLPETAFGMTAEPGHKHPFPRRERQSSPPAGAITKRPSKTPVMMTLKYSTDFEWMQSPSSDLSTPGAKTVSLASCQAAQFQIRVEN